MTTPTPTVQPVQPTYTVPEKLSDLNILPPTYVWRPWQRAVVQRIVNSPKKIIMLEAECGSGKSVEGVAAAAVLGGDCIVLTQTLNLQQQYLRDFSDARYAQAVMMAGRSHEICNKTGKRADRAPCTIGAKCGLVGQWDKQTGMPIEPLPECNYFLKKALAKRAKISIQNYAYWLAETSNFRSSFKSANVIICDEGHDLDQMLMAAATIEIRRDDCRSMQIIPPRDSADGKTWLEWARSNIVMLNSKQQILKNKAAALGLDLGDSADGSEYDPTATDDEIVGDPLPDDVSSSALLERTIDDLKAVGRLLAAIGAILLLTATLIDEEWAATSDKLAIFLKPIYGRYGFPRILQAARTKVVIMSAYLAPALLMEALGVSADDVEVIDGGRVFDRKDSPIYYCPTVKMRYDPTSRGVTDRKFVVAAADAFITMFSTKHKGFFHVPSVAFRDEILNWSSQRAKMIPYDNKNTDAASGFRSKYPDKDAAINMFVQRRNPCVLLGQSISTGLDLPGVAGYQIIPKLSFPPITDPAIKKRMDKDPLFYPFLTLCQLVQACGRIKREQGTGGPTIILDEQFTWFWAKYRAYFPPWFTAALKYNGWAEFPDVKATVKRAAFAAGKTLWK